MLCKINLPVLRNMHSEVATFKDGTVYVCKTCQRERRVSWLYRMPSEDQGRMLSRPRTRGQADDVRLQEQLRMDAGRKS